MDAVTRPRPIRIAPHQALDVVGHDVLVQCRLAGTQAVIDAAARSDATRRLELLRQAVGELAAVISSEADRLTVLALAS